MNGKYILENGQPVPCADVIKWAKWFGGVLANNERRVARTEFDGGYISTVFLGLDHQWGGGPPLLWETMAFGGPLDGEQERWSSLADAKAGHDAMVARCILTKEQRP